MWQSGSARFSFNRSGPGLQPDATARTSPQRAVKGSRPNLQHEMRLTVFVLSVVYSHVPVYARLPEIPQLTKETT